MKTGFVAAMVALTVAVGAAPVQGHHSFSMFDGTKKVRLVGVVREFQWSNPHVWIELGVPGKDGKLVNWSIEAPAVNGLARVGWTSRSLKPGDKVTLEMHPLKTGGKGGALVSAVLANGTRLGETMIQKGRDQSGR